LADPGRMLRGGVVKEQSQSESQISKIRVARSWCLQGLYQERRVNDFKITHWGKKSRRPRGDCSRLERLETSPKIFKIEVSRKKVRRG
jgi:hypothetical protein